MASKHNYNSRAAIICLALSLLVHLVFAVPLDFFKSFKLGTVVLPSQPIVVDLQETMATEPAKQLPPSLPAAASTSLESALKADEQTIVPAAEPSPGKRETEAAPVPSQERSTASPIVVPAKSTAGGVAGQKGKVFTTQQKDALPEAPLPPIRKSGEFLATDQEILSYRISMWGIPVGTAELEAKQENGEVRITLRIQSNAATSRLYPVDDCIETRHIGGNFILSRIRQQEGAFRGDRGFTLFLRDKSVFWIDRIKNLSLQEPLPNSDVVDILSGLYYLRNQPLEVGKFVNLQLFDSNHYAPTTVAVLRKEHLTLPGLREVDTLLINPQLKTDGIFQRTGEILVWLTDDEKKVPVKVETRISLGKVTAELVSAQTHRQVESPTRDMAKKKSSQ